MSEILICFYAKFPLWKTGKMNAGTQQCTHGWKCCFEWILTSVGRLIRLRCQTLVAFGFRSPSGQQGGLLSRVSPLPIGFCCLITFHREGYGLAAAAVLARALQLKTTHWPVPNAIPAWAMCCQVQRSLTSLSMEVLMSSSLPSCRWTELMLKTILLWFWPSEDVPNRVHLCFPDLVKSHMTNSPLGRHQHKPINPIISQALGFSKWRSPKKKPTRVLNPALTKHFTVLHFNGSVLCSILLNLFLTFCQETFDKHTSRQYPEN